MTNHSYLDSPLHGSESTNVEESGVRFVHSVSEAGRLLPSASRWNSIEVEFGGITSSHPQDSCGSLPSNYSKSVEFNLVITNRRSFKRFICISLFVIFVILAIILLLKFLRHNTTHNSHSTDYAIPLNQALTFFDEQKSGPLPLNNTVKFRSDSGVHDGDDIHVGLVGGFYDSGNNIKFGLPTAYTVTLLSWSVIEYHKKYAAIGELDHVKDIIRWGSDYLLKVFVPSTSASKPAMLYSQVGSTDSNSKENNDVTCWQRPEDMTYPRPVSACRQSASDLAGETAAALASASLVFKDEVAYSAQLTESAEGLFAFATDRRTLGTYTSDKDCGAEARPFYNSSGYLDELVWGGIWLFFATGNASYLSYVTKHFKQAEDEQLTVDDGVLDWNSKLSATAVLLTRLQYLHDPGYPYLEALTLSTDMTDLLMCSYLSLHQNFGKTPGGLILLRPPSARPLQFAATAAFLTKVYSDYLDVLRNRGGSCGDQSFSLEMMQAFSSSQVEYILGKNPLKMSYLVGFGEHFPGQVHHRAASIAWDNQHYSCAQGDHWLNSQDPNPNVLIGAMVAGPDQDDKFSDKRNMPLYTEPSISGNAGLVAALIALHNSPSSFWYDTNTAIDPKGIFANIHLDPSGDASP